MRKLVLLGLLGILMIGLESLLSPSQAPVQPQESLSYTDWQRLKELFH
jgi:hypothetical protein